MSCWADPIPGRAARLERAGADERRTGVGVSAFEAECLAGAHLPDAAAAADVVRERGDSRRAIEGQKAVIEHAAGAVDRSGAAGGAAAHLQGAAADRGRSAVSLHAGEDHGCRTADVEARGARDGRGEGERSAASAQVVGAAAGRERAAEGDVPAGAQAQAAVVSHVDRLRIVGDQRQAPAEAVVILPLVSQPFTVL